jgi:Transcription factor WhiB
MVNIMNAQEQDLHLLATLDRSISQAAAASQRNDLAPSRSAFRREKRLWILNAGCRGDDPAKYDPVNRNSATRAQAVCLTCPARRECLLEALLDEAETTYGPWLIRGGFTPKDRRELDGEQRADLIQDLCDSLTRSRKVWDRDLPPASMSPHGSHDTDTDQRKEGHQWRGI